MAQKLAARRYNGRSNSYAKTSERVQKVLQKRNSGIVLKSKADIEAMRIAGQLAGEVLQMIRESVVAGVSTLELDDICHRHITQVQSAIPAPLNYKGFP